MKIHGKRFQEMISVLLAVLIMSAVVFTGWVSGSPKQVPQLSPTSIGAIRG